MFAKFAGLIDTAVRRSIKFDDIERTGAIGREVNARCAFAARFCGRTLSAVERTGEDAGARRLATTARAAEEVGVVGAIRGQGAHQRGGHMVLADDLRKGSRTIGAIQSE